MLKSRNIGVFHRCIDVLKEPHRTYVLRMMEEAKKEFPKKLYPNFKDDDVDAGFYTSSQVDAWFDKWFGEEG